MMEPEEYARVVVVGGGLAGLCATIKLLEAGISPVVTLEKSQEPGGVWHTNTYPGCACDVPAHLYSLSFEDETDWSCFYPRQSELLAYVKGIVKKHGLVDKGIMRLNTKVVDARWREEQQSWDVLVEEQQQEEEGVGTSQKEKTKKTKLIRAQFLVAATGALVQPLIPELEGMDEFKGPSLHTSRWDQSLNLTNKRVAVIGTGASAIQVVTPLAKQAAHLSVFQRTPAWVLPKFNFRFPPWARWVLQRRALYRKLFRAWNFWSRELLTCPVFLNPKGPMNKMYTAWVHKYLEKQVSDPELRKKLTPDYTLGCKRVLLSDNFYKTMTRPNVSLVASGVTKVDADGVTDSNGEHHPCDAIVWATGFELPALWDQVAIYGREGKHWSEVFAHGVSSYVGLVSPGAPNFYMLNGPYTALGHTSILLMTEAQVNFMIDLIRQMDAAGATVSSVKTAVCEAYHEEMQTRLHETVWTTGGCQSWYLTSKDSSDILWPSTVLDFQRRTKYADLAVFDLQDAKGQPFKDKRSTWSKWTGRLFNGTSGRNLTTNKRSPSYSYLAILLVLLAAALILGLTWSMSRRSMAASMPLATMGSNDTIMMNSFGACLAADATSFVQQAMVTARAAAAAVMGLVCT